jgi:hypothetical protein
MIKNYLRALVVSLLLFCFMQANLLHAQDMQKQYTVVNRSLTGGNDAGGIHLDEVDGVGIAWINGKKFTRGTIEFDIRGKDKMQGSFVGFAFHGVNDSTYEAIYFRPFNFRAADPVRKGHAVQYIASPKYDWPKLRADFPNKYEQPVSPAPDPDQWFHVRITVADEKISVYINNGDQPSLTVIPLAKTGGKMIGYWVGNTSGGDWKNLRVVNRD